MTDIHVRARRPGRAGLALAVATSVGAQTDHRARERALLRELVEINTRPSAQRTVEAADAMRKHLLAAGMPTEDVRVISVVPDERDEPHFLRARRRKPAGRRGA